MEALSEYIRVIAFYMVFAAFAEIISPSGPFKKYIRLILSLILIALIIKPLGGLLRGAGGGLEENRRMLQGVLGNELAAADRSAYEREQAALVLAEYKTALNEQARRVIEEQTGIRAVSAEARVNEDYESESFAALLEVYATVSIPAPKAVSESKRILLGGAGTQLSAEQLRAAAEQKIKKCLAGFYNIPEDNIYITVLDNGFE